VGWGKGEVARRFGRFRWIGGGAGQRRRHSNQRSLPPETVARSVELSDLFDENRRPVETV
jgi:hypothetical protein